jgi:hypothetical protein
MFERHSVFGEPVFTIVLPWIAMSGLSLILGFENSLGLYMLQILAGRAWVHIAIIPKIFYIIKGGKK